VDVQQAAPSAKPAFLRFLPVVARVAMGLMFFVFGLNGFLDFIPHPAKPPPEAAMAFAGALMKTGYMFPLIKGLETLAGLLLLANRFVPLALVLLAPIIVNIVAFHALLEKADLAIPVLVAVFEVFLMWVYRAAYRPLFIARARPESL
jgi:uncharacterized membrane protein YphA (DoxX/SURF4 family)